MPYLDPLVKEWWQVLPGKVIFPLHSPHCGVSCKTQSTLSRVGGGLPGPSKGESVCMFEVLCKGDFASLPSFTCIFNHLFIWLWIYFTLWMIIQCYLIYVVAQVVLAIGNSFRLAPGFPFFFQRLSSIYNYYIILTTFLDLYNTSV